MKRLLILVIALALAQSFGCGGSSPTSPSGTARSSTPSATSHNAGNDCTRCHSFTIAGTAYRADGVTPYAGAVVRLTTASAGGGTVAASVTADGSGNFYTDAAISFGTGLYASATGSGGSVRSMGAPVTGGACNRCHASGARIVVD